MSANTYNRKTAREAFAALLSTALTGVGNPVQEVFDHITRVPIDEDRKSPVVMVGSSGTRRVKSGLNDPRFNSYIYLEVFTFVRGAETANGWTEDNVEDMLDDIDKRIADVVADNRVNANWDFIDFTEDKSELVVDPETGYHVELRVVEIRRMDR